MSLEMFLMAKVASNLLADADILFNHLAEILHGGFKLAIALVGLHFIYGLYKTLEIGLGADDILEAHTTKALDDGGDVAIGKRELLHHFGINAIFIEILLDGLVDIGVALGNHTYHNTFLL